ncbi:Zinc finger, BED-type [Sesbania bispinosa]|nr:Zinc finger, BED-type [Sesbania bispinosa]
MENLCEVTPSKLKEYESSSSPIMAISPTPPKSTPSNPITSSDGKGQSQSQTNPLPSPALVDSDNYEITEDGKRKKVSVVWNHFKRKIINGEDKALCNYCNKLLSWRRTDGTHHLHKHFQTCKRRPYRDIR